MRFVQCYLQMDKNQMKQKVQQVYRQIKNQQKAAEDAKKKKISCSNSIKLILKG